jgi:hypothetical protein
MSHLLRHKPYQSCNLVTGTWTVSPPRERARIYCTSLSRSLLNRGRWLALRKKSISCCFYAGTDCARTPLWIAQLPFFFWVSKFCTATSEGMILELVGQIGLDIQGLLFSHILQRSFGSTMLAHLFWIDDNCLWDYVGNGSENTL